MLTGRRAHKALLGVALFFLEGAWLYLLTSLLARALGLGQAEIPFAVAFLAVSAGYLVTGFIVGLALPPRVMRVLGVAVSIVGILALGALRTGDGLVPVAYMSSGDGTADVLFMWAFLTAMWWRGGMLVADSLDFDRMVGTFRLGVIVVVLVVGLGELVKIRVASTPFLVAFFGVGLTSLALARFSRFSTISTVLGREWMLPVLGSVGLVLGLGVALSLLLAGGIDDLARGLLEMVGEVALWVLTPVILVFGFIAQGLTYVFQWLVGVFGGEAQPPPEVTTGVEVFRENLEQGKGLPPVLVMLLKWGAFGLAVGAGALVLALLFRFTRRTKTQEGQEVRESLFSWQTARDDLSDLLGQWLANLRRRRRGAANPVRDPRTPEEIYHNLLLVSADLGVPRRPWQTPTEHRRRLGGLLPVMPVDRIVGGFQEAKYGGRSLDGGRMGQLQQDWQVVAEAHDALVKDGGQAPTEDEQQDPASQGG